MIKECAKPVKLKGKRKIPPRGKEKKEYTPVENRMTPEEGIKEAERCLGLRTCESCEICSLFCPDLCITRDEDGEVRIDLNYCKGCGICAAVCPKGAIQMVLDKEN